MAAVHKRREFQRLMFMHTRSYKFACLKIEHSGINLLYTLFDNCKERGVPASVLKHKKTQRGKR